MDISAISSIISEGRKGTRIPEELLGLPPRNARYARLSMDAIEPVSGLRTSRAVTSAQEAEETQLAQAVQGLVDSASATSDDTFRNLLMEAIDAQTTATADGASSLLSDPAYYRNLMMLSSFSSGLLSSNLQTFGSSGLTL